MSYKYINHKCGFYVSIFLFFILVSALISPRKADGGTDTIGTDTETIEYSYNGTDVNIKFEEQKSIHLSLPADEYIIRLKSIGDFELYFLPKDKNSLVENLFVHECDAAIVTINNKSYLTHTPICLSGQIVKKENNKEKNENSKKEQSEERNISLNNTNNIKTGIYSFEQKDVSKSVSGPSEEEKKEYSYFIETITEQQIKIIPKNKTVEKKLVDLVENQDKYGSSICGYYIVSNECPYIEVQWVGGRKSFVNFLHDNSMLNKGLFDLK